jgi:hypothetical protein
MSALDRIRNGYDASYHNPPEWFGGSLAVRLALRFYCSNPYDELDYLQEQQANIDRNTQTIAKIIDTLAFERVVSWEDATTWSYEPQKMDDVIDALATRCKRLEEPNFSASKLITNKSVATIASKCPMLTSVHFANCDKLSDIGVASFASACPLLTRVNLNLCPITDAGVSALATRCPLLTSVNLKRCPIADAGVSALAARCPLRTIDLSCTGLTDAGVASLATSCPSLTSVAFADCFVTDTGIACLAAKGRRLERVNLNSCSELTDAAAASLAGGCPRLADVDLSNRHNRSKITDATAASLAAGCPLLVRVCLDRCRMITCATVDMLVSKCPKLQALSILECERIAYADVRQHCLGTRCKISIHNHGPFLRISADDPTRFVLHE